MTFPEPRWCVPGLVPDGLTVLAGRPKSGKSWLALQIAVAVASGGHVLDRVVDEGDVLYLGLEDTARRLQSRLRRIMGDEPWPEALHLWLDADRALNTTERFLKAHPEAGLVVVDTLARVRRPHHVGRPVYDQDYNAIGEWKALADRYGVAILTVHHTRKSAAEDVVDLVNGSHGLTGAADTICVLRRRQGDAHGRLDVTGRDVADISLALVWHPHDCTWSTSGNLDEPTPSPARNDVVEALDVLGPATPAEVAALLDVPSDTVRQRLHRMRRDGEVERHDDGRYTAVTGHAVTRSRAADEDRRDACDNVTRNTQHVDVDLLVDAFDAVDVDEIEHIRGWNEMCDDADENQPGVLAYLARYGRSIEQ